MTDREKDITETFQAYQKMVDCIDKEMKEEIKQAMNDDPSYAKDSVQYLYGSDLDNRGYIMTEARLLTEREVFSNSNRNKLMWLEVREPLNGFYVLQVTPRSFNHWSEVMVFDNASCDNHILHLSAFDFKKTWRCWSDEPTDNQRKVEAWEEETLAKRWLRRADFYEFIQRDGKGAEIK